MDQPKESLPDSQKYLRLLEKSSSLSRLVVGFFVFVPQKEQNEMLDGKHVKNLIRSAVIIFPLF